LHNLTQILGVNHSSTIALSAWESLLINLRAEALDANDFVLGTLLFAIRNDEIAADFSFLDVAVDLRAGILHGSSHTTDTDISSLSGGLRPHIAGFNHRVNILVLHVDLGCVAASIILGDQVVDVCGDVDSVHEDIFITTADLVSTLSL